MTARELELKSAVLRRDSKPIEFEGFGNCGEFAIIKRWGGQAGLDFNSVEFDGIRILNSVVFHN